MEDEIRMTKGPIARAIISFAVPLFFGNLFQQLYSAVDSLIVGNLLGNDALAAITGTANLIDLLVGFFQGLFIGAGIVIARFFGAENKPLMRKSIHTTITLAFFTGIFLSVFGTAFTPAMLRMMGTPEEIFGLTVSYIRIYFISGIFLVLYNACTGILQAVGDSKHPLYYLIVSSVLNVILDLLFIGVFHWGIASAAAATGISQCLSVILSLIRLTRTREDYHITLNALRFDRDMLKLVLTFGLPSGFQNSVIGIANVVVQSHVNAFGTMAVAGCGAYSKLSGFAFIPINSFTAALSTYVGQNLGAKEYERTQKGARFGILCSIALAEGIGIIMYLTAPILIGAFTREEEAIAYGVRNLRILTPFYFLLAGTHCLSAVLRGAGKVTVPMIVLLSVWCVFRVTWLTVMVPITHSIDTVNWCYPLTWSISTVILLIYFRKADWLGLKGQ